MNKVAIIIPARYGSTRFPGKSLALLQGKPMIQWVWEAASRCRLKARVIVATDDQRIFKMVESFGGEVMMTKRTHPSGTDRIAEVGRRVPASVYINLQGDEPLLHPSALNALIKKMGNADIATLAHPIGSEKEWRDPNAVKVVFNKKGEALYFSRSPIPYSAQFAPSNPGWRHVGIYAYRAKALQQFVGWRPGSLEKLEKLEQLRALEKGLKIKVISTKFRCLGVDTPADLAEAEEILLRRKLVPTE
jgi:3-deoxy-manno-octulosonate cytidylyltransferase (CMP-KDO synthetase)